MSDDFFFKVFLFSYYLWSFTIYWLLSTSDIYEHVSGQIQAILLILLIKPSIKPMIIYHQTLMYNFQNAVYVSTDTLHWKECPNIKVCKLPLNYL